MLTPHCLESVNSKNYFNLAKIFVLRLFKCLQTGLNMALPL